MMAKKRHTKDFRIPGKVRYTERNPRGKNAEWIEFACTKDETNTIMESIGLAIQQTTKCELPAGTLLAQICREWMQALKSVQQQPKTESVRAFPFDKKEHRKTIPCDDQPKCETCGGSGRITSITGRTDPPWKPCPKCQPATQIKIFRCKHFRAYSQSVPVPFGSGNCSEQLGDCAIESESENCTFECPDYEESPDGPKPAAQTGELVKRLITAYNQPFTIVTHGDYPLSAKDIIQLLGDAAARLEELEKALQEIASWSMHSGIEEYAKGDYAQSYYLMEDEIFKAKKMAKAALGEEKK